MKRIFLALLVALMTLVLTNPARANSLSLAYQYEKDITLHGMVGTSSRINSKAAGLIYKSVFGGSLTTLRPPLAVWGLSSTAERDNSYIDATTDASYLDLAKTPSSSAYPGLLLYTQLNGRPGSGFEPASLTLIGTGLVGLAGAIRRKLAKAA